MRTESLSVYRASGGVPAAFQGRSRRGEIAIVHEGQAVHRAGEKTTRLKSGDVLILMGAQDQEYGEARDVEVLGVRFTPETLLGGFPEIDGLPGFTALFNLDGAYGRRTPYSRHLHLSYRVLSYLTSIVAKMEGLLQAPQAGSPFLTRLSFLEMLSVLCRASTAHPGAPEESAMIVREAVRFVDGHFKERIALEELAKVVGLSRTQLIRHFKMAVGCSPIEYIIRRRIAYACELLRTTQRSITDIAFETGFNDSNYLTRQFSRIMRMPPTVYREQ